MSTKSRHHPLSPVFDFHATELMPITESDDKMNAMKVNFSTTTIDGRKYAILPLDELRELRKVANTKAASLPSFPKTDRKGLLDGDQTMVVAYARRVVRAREKTGLTQTALAKKLGMPIATLNRIEQAKQKPRRATKEKLTKVFKKLGIEV